jgi:hypothetical protein
MFGPILHFVDCKQILRNVESPKLGNFARWSESEKNVRQRRSAFENRAAFVYWRQSRTMTTRAGGFSPNKVVFAEWNCERRCVRMFGDETLRDDFVRSPFRIIRLRAVDHCKSPGHRERIRHSCKDGSDPADCHDP